MRKCSTGDWPSDVTQRTSLPYFDSPIFTVTVRTGSVPEQKQVIGESGSSFGIRKKGSTLLSRLENLIWHNLYVTGYGRTSGALGNVTFRAQPRLVNWGIVKAGILSPVSKSFPQNAHPSGQTKEHGGEGQERLCKHWRERRFIWQIMRLLKGGSGLRALGGDWRTRWWCLGKTGLTGVYVGAEALSCELVLYEPSSSAPLLSSRLSPADTPIGGLCTVTEAWARMEELASSPSQNDLPGTSVL